MFIRIALGPSSATRLTDANSSVSDGACPSSQKALLDAASKRADKLRAKGKDVDFDDLCWFPARN